MNAVESLIAYWKERAVSPLTGAIVSTWCIVNYRFFLMAFSEEHFSYKFKMISEFYSSFYNVFGMPFFKLNGYLYYGVVWPACVVGVYFFVYPKVSIKIYKVALGYQKITNELKKKMSDNELLTVEESENLRQSHAEELLKKNKYAGEIKSESESLAAELDDLKGLQGQVASSIGGLVFLHDRNISEKISIALNNVKMPSMFSVSSLLSPEDLIFFKEEGYDLNRYFSYYCGLNNATYMPSNREIGSYYRLPDSFNEILLGSDSEKLLMRMLEENGGERFSTHDLMSVIKPAKDREKFLDEMVTYSLLQSFEYQRDVNGAVQKLGTHYRLTSQGKDIVLDLAGIVDK